MAVTIKTNLLLNRSVNSFFAMFSTLFPVISPAKKIKFFYFIKSCKTVHPRFRCSGKAGCHTGTGAQRPIDPLRLLR